MQTKEKIAAQRKTFREANREKIAAYSKAYRAANREKYAAYNKTHREANREKYAAKKKIYAAAHLNEYLAHCHKQRAKKAGVRMGDAKAVLYWLKGWKTEAPVACHYCKSLSPGTDMTMDHVIPMSAGGPHDLANLVVCCQSCNSSKKNKLPEVWLAFKAAC